MVGIQINKKNHEKLMAIRDEGGLKSFNEVLNKILPEGSVSGMDFEQEKPAFALINTDNTVLNIKWEQLKKAQIGQSWSNGETATILYKDESGVLIRFVDEYNEVYLNYFHFLE